MKSTTSVNSAVKLSPAELPVRFDLHLEKENDHLGPFRKSANKYQHVTGEHRRRVTLESCSCLLNAPNSACRARLPQVGMQRCVAKRGSVLVSPYLRLRIA